MFKVSPFHEEYGLNVVRCNMCSIMLGFPVPLRLYNVWGRGEIRDKAEALPNSKEKARVGNQESVDIDDGKRRHGRRSFIGRLKLEDIPLKALLMILILGGRLFSIQLILLII